MEFLCLHCQSYTHRVSHGDNAHRRRCMNCNFLYSETEYDFSSGEILRRVNREHIRNKKIR